MCTHVTFFDKFRDRSTEWSINTFQVCLSLLPYAPVLSANNSWLLRHDRMVNFRRLVKNTLRAGVHAPTKSVSVPASIWLLPPVQTRSGVHTYRENRYGRLQGGQFREWCRAVNMAPMWNRRFYLLCLLHLRRRWRLKRREREFWEHHIVAARTLEGAYYTPYGRLREDERKFCNYFRMSTSTFDYIVDRLAPHLERQNTMMRESICPRQILAVTLR